MDSLNVMLNLDNKSTYLDNMRKVIACEGKIGLSIINRVNPITQLVKPMLNQQRKHQDQNGDWNVVEGKYTFGTMSCTVPNIADTNADGSIKLIHTDANLDSFDKSILLYNLEVTKLETVMSKISRVLNSTISENSIAVLKSKGLELYLDAQTDPVKMLKLIDSTHTLTDDVNKLKSLTDLIDCKQTSFVSYTSFIAEFERMMRVMIEQFCSAPTKEIMLDSICKSLLVYNVNKLEFQFVIQSIHASKTELSYRAAATEFMNFYKNASPQLLLGNAAIIKSKLPNAPNTVEGKCSGCKQNVKLKVNPRTNTPHAMCNKCFTKSLKKNESASAGTAVVTTNSAALPTKDLVKPATKTVQSKASSAMQAMFAEDTKQQ